MRKGAFGDAASIPASAAIWILLAPSNERCPGRGMPPLLSLRLRASTVVTLLRTDYLVDPASSHMLVSKIKPCMCKYEQIQTVKLRMAH